jgi:hypothetical protein
MSYNVLDVTTGNSFSGVTSKVIFEQVLSGAEVSEKRLFIPCRAEFPLPADRFLVSSAPPSIRLSITETAFSD